MKKEQPLSIAVLEEAIIFLAIVGISTILWALEGERTGFWREVPKSTLLGYLIRFVAEWLTRRRGKPLYRLTPHDRGD